jgi:hypothetical protein
MSEAEAQATLQTEGRALRGSEAAAVLESRAFMRAVQVIAAGYAREAQSAKGPDEAWQAVLRARALGDVIKHLQATVVDGRHAEGEISKLDEAERDTANLEDNREEFASSYMTRASEARSKFLSDLKQGAQVIREDRAAQAAADAAAKEASDAG